MTAPTVSTAQRWRPEALLGLSAGCDDAARTLTALVDDAAAEAERSRDHWTGAAADAARERAQQISAVAAEVARRLVTASVAARDGAEQITAARAHLLDEVERARRDGLDVADDGSVTVASAPSSLLVLLAGGQEAVAVDMLEVRAREMSARIGEALRRLGAADADAADDIAAALAVFAAPVLERPAAPVLERPAAPVLERPAATVPAGAWPVRAADVVDAWPSMSQDRIAAQVAAMTPEQRQRLLADFPEQVGNTDGIPWDMRAAANRLNIAAAILAETGSDGPSRDRIAFYRGLLGEIDDPAGRGRITRTIVAFDPGRASLVELNGDLAAARSLAVLVPGVNTTIEGSAANTATAQRFVAATGGDVAVITYLGGPFPQVHNPADVVFDAADPRYALEMAPRLVAFSEDVDRQVPDGVLVTVMGHSYGGSIVGTAETLGLTSDRTLFLAAAGAGVGVDDPGDWRNRNPAVQRYSMTAPGDFIELVQGIPGGRHGADPDEMSGVIRLRTGVYDDGGAVAGWDAHSGMLNRPSDAWRTILAVITGDRRTVDRAAVGVSPGPSSPAGG
ncbi:alpha/beta hydrolase [Mycobacterium sp. ITM-2016-00317]|uniref:alpha/beta hydrolase n=1 Tax=Mycobacterium sp. ITM-2016-00317 TaxID=2099694 RepID=UPI00287FB76D|nr:alpha/beta hydrolase [Mycobacterium sp. ITM-2016-00317]WNG85524.1 alpha/beta hydrolase [Mycobacterium sp. ITM-2016-00317]